MNSVVGLKQHQEAIKQNTKLDTLGNKLDKIAVDVKVNGKVQLTSLTGQAVYADSFPIPTQDEDNRNGWLFTKTQADASKFNYFFYSQGNKALTLADLKGLNAEISIDSYSNTSSIPFFVVYTKMTGINDGAWYHSKIVYTLTADETISIGERISIWSIKKPVIYDKIRQVEFNNKQIFGEGLPTEEILTISLQSDSDSVTGTKILVKEVGFDIGVVEQRTNLR
tara:strand:+ start:3666 stop:4337 length:672 start_codon:yes stop_codon:yes gene_type:complete